MAKNITKVLFSYPNGTGPLYYDCEGHSDYVSDMGWNDCCVAVSTLNVMLINYIEQYGIEPEICQDGHVRIVIEDADEYIIEVFKAAEKQFWWLADRYKEHIKCY